MSLRKAFTHGFVTLLALLVGGEALAERTTTYFHTDGLGSVVAATNEAGQVIWRKDYAPFGEQIHATPDTERTSYTGKQYDKEIGLTYFGGRYFDPEIGRFVSVDPVGFVAAEARGMRRACGALKSARNGMPSRARVDNVRPMNTHIHFDIGPSTLGCVLAATSDQGICAILLGDSAEVLTRELAQRFPTVERIRHARRLASTLERITAFIESPTADLDLPLDLAGTDFQQRVWRALRGIPRGATASYAEVARRISAPNSFRAVAQACGANPVALAVPCHRVVRGDGGLSGYRWGIARKRALLEREARA